MNSKVFYSAFLLCLFFSNPLSAYSQGEQEGEQKVSNTIVSQGKTIYEWGVMALDQVYIFTPDYQISPEFEGTVLESENEWYLEILTKDGTNYSYPLFEESYNKISVKISALPEKNDYWLRDYDGPVRARIHLKTLYSELTEGGPQNKECDAYFHFSIPHKPDKPQIRIIEIVVEGTCTWPNNADITFEYSADGATSFLLFHEIEHFSGVSHTPFPTSGTCTIQCIDFDIENYFTLTAYNVYGKTVGEILIYGGIYTDLTSIDVDNLSVYPNPAKDFISVRQNNSGEKYQVSIFDTSGQLMIKTSVVEENEKIPLANLPKGHYMLKVEQPDNNFSKAFKFIKIE